MRARSGSLAGLSMALTIMSSIRNTIRISPYNYNAVTFRKEKVKNKTALQQELGLDVDPKKFMIGIVSRLTDQKGLDLIQYVMDEMCSSDDLQLVVLGTGDEKYENMFRHFAWKYGGRVSANIYYPSPCHTRSMRPVTHF